MRSKAPEKNKRYFNYAIALAWATIIYNIIEGALAIGFGLSDEPLTLFGFGLDSFVEVISASGVLQMIHRRRLNPQSEPSQFEVRALRITGYCFYALVAILLISAGLSLFENHQPISTLPGLVIACISIASMWALIWAKTKVGRQLNSEAIIADANCNRVCLYMSIVLLLASALQYFFKLPYVDALGALALSYFALNEGRESFEKARGAACSC